MTWDAVVIGAGPAGSVTARELARRGCRVLLVDKAAFPRAKVCGCCVNGAAVATLNRLGLGGVVTGAVPLTRFTVAAGRHSADVALPRGAALSREALDTRLIAEAARAGVEFRPETVARLGDVAAPLRSRLATGRAATARERLVSLNGEPVAARVVVLASGLTGGEAPPDAGSRVGAGVVLPPEDSPDYFRVGRIYMATGRGGYVGLVRVEDGRLDVAAAFDASFVKSAGGLGPAACAILGEVGWPVPPGLAARAWKGTPALTRRPVSLGGHRVFVVGDAAGYVEPFTGEGMAWAVMSAAALAPIAADGVREWSPHLVAAWEAAHHRAVGSRQGVCRAAARVLRSPGLTTLAVRVLRTFPVLARPVLGAINRPPSSLPRALA